MKDKRVVISIIVILVLIAGIIWGIRLIKNHPLIALLVGGVIVFGAVGSYISDKSPKKSDQSKVKNPSPSTSKSKTMKSTPSTNDILEDAEQEFERNYLRYGGKLFYFCPANCAIALMTPADAEKLNARGEKWIKAKTQCFSDEIAQGSLLTEDEKQRVEYLHRINEDAIKKLRYGVDNDVAKQYMTEQMGGKENEQWYYAHYVIYYCQIEVEKEAVYHHVEEIENYAHKRIATYEDQEKYINEHTSSDQRKVHHEWKAKLDEEKRKKREEEERRHKRETEEMISGMEARKKLQQEEAERNRRAEEYGRQLEQDRYQRDIAKSLYDIERELEKMNY